MFNSTPKIKKVIKDPKKIKQIESWKRSDVSKISSAIHKKERASFDTTTEFLDNCINFHKEEIEFMLDLGIDINCADKDNLTALHQACINAKMDLVLYLLSKKANINAVDTEGWTPLHIAASIGSLELAKCLIDRGARLDIVNYDGDLPVALADEEDHQDLKCYLQSEMNKRNINETLCRNMERNIMMEDVMKWKSLGVYEPPIDDDIKFTPLHVAASKNYLDVLTELTSLLTKDELNAQDMDGWTALHAAAHWGNRDACLILMKAGADMDIVTKANETVFDLMDEDIKIGLQEDFRRFKMENLRLDTANQASLRNESSNKRRTSIVRQSVQMKKYAQSKDPVMERQIQDAAKNTDLPSVVDEDFSPRPNNVPTANSHCASITEGDETSNSLKQSVPSTISVTSPCITYQTKTSDIVPSSDKELNKSYTDQDYIFKTPPLSDGDKCFLNEEANNAAVCDMSENSFISEQSDSPVKVQLRPKSERDSIIERRNTTTRMSLVMAPAKCDESESNRREKARRIRSNRRSTQGINLETMDAIKKRQNELENGPGVSPKEVNKTIPEEQSIDFIDGLSINDQSSNIVVDNSASNTAPDSSLSSPQQNDSAFSKVVPKARITRAIDSIRKLKTPLNSTPLTNVTTTTTNVIIPAMRFDASKPSATPVTTITHNTPNFTPRTVVTDKVHVPDSPDIKQEVDSGSFVAKPMSVTTIMMNSDTTHGTTLRPSASAVSSVKPNLRFQNSVTNSDSISSDYVNRGQSSRTIVNSLTNNQITIKEQNIEITKLKQRIEELENRLRNEPQVNNNLEEESELTRTKKENRTLKSQNESLLRVINKIQQELYSLNPVSPSKK